MTRIANDEGAARTYRSELRTQQAEETRARILDAAIRVMARGVPFVSIPAVAREAGVSVPTVYRHFRAKRDLLAAVFPHVVRRAGLDELVPPRSIDDLGRGVRALFERIDSAGDLARAAAASPAAEEVRRVDMPARLEMSRRLADSIVPKLTRGDRDRIARLLTILISASALRVWRDHLGSTVEEAANDIDWVISAAIAASTRSEP
jgi:AcrR family transcriptional regulator